MTDLDGLGGLHSPAEGRMLMDLARGVPAGQAIIEVGTYTGVSALWMAAGARLGAGARITCIDPWPDPREGEPDREHAERQRHALARFRAHMDQHDWPVTPLRARSVDVAAMWLQPVGLAFIDGDHSYRGVSSDVEMWAPHIAPGGWLALHDFLGDGMEPDTDVARYVRATLARDERWSLGPLVDKMWTAQRTG